MPEKRVGSSRRLPTANGRRDLPRDSLANGAKAKSPRVPPPDGPIISLSAECFYGLEEDDQTDEADNGYGDLNFQPRPPRLIRFLRCRCVLPDVPLRRTSRVIVTLKCLRRTKLSSPRLSGSNNGSAPGTTETIWSRFSRVWPKDESDGITLAGMDDMDPSSVTKFDQTNAVDFTLPIPHDLPQSIDYNGSSITYTIQVHANLRTSVRDTSETPLYSQELPIEIPPPESAFTPSRLPKRITNGSMGQSQDHYGILITPDISLHVSVPREINYSRFLNSVFRIHIKLMPHPPEAKLPGIRKLSWTLLQTTNLAHGATQGTDVPESSSSKKPPAGLTNTTLVSGDVQLASTSSLAGDDKTGMGSRKDQYLYIALPENSTDLLPEYEDNKFIEVLHTLDIDLYPAAPLPSDGLAANGIGGDSSPNGVGGVGSRVKDSMFGKIRTFGKGLVKPRIGRPGSASSSPTLGSGNGGSTFGGAVGSGKKVVYKASIPIRITFDANEIGRRPQAMASSTPDMDNQHATTIPIAIASGIDGHGRLAIESR